MDALFYSIDGQERKGPVTKDEFIQLSLSADTLVWYEGQPNWSKAGDIPDLKELFQRVPYAPVNYYSPPNTPTAYQGRAGTESTDSININKSTINYVLLGVGGLIILFLLFKLIRGNSDHSPEREPFVQTYASNFAARLMKATYPFSGRNPTYEVTE